MNRCVFVMYTENALVKNGVAELVDQDLYCSYNVRDPFILMVRAGSVVN